MRSNEYQKKLIKILVTGMGNSGTSYLCSCLGSHPDITMLFEDTGKSWLKGYGTNAVGNKLCLQAQIRYDKRANLYTKIINKIFFYFKGEFYPDRPYPTSRLSLVDYLNIGSKIIVIVRNKTDTIKSIINRRRLNEKQAIKLYGKSEKQLFLLLDQNVLNKNVYVVRYERLVIDLKAELDKICRWLGLEYSSQMLKGYEKNWHYLDAEGKRT